jgi:hypothetical protein
VYNTSCKSCQEENEPSQLFAIHLYTLLELCEITLFLKTFLSIMITCAEIDYTLRFWLRHILHYVTPAPLQLVSMAIMDISI